RLAPPDLADEIARGTLSVCAALPGRGCILLIEPAEQHLAVLFSGRSLKLISLEGARPVPVESLGDSVPHGRMPLEAAMVLSKTTDPKILMESDILVSAQLRGITEASRDHTVYYAKLRNQFGKPIGAFQAITRHCDNMAIN